MKFRIIALGRSDKKILRIVYTRRNSVIRIISARKANKHDREEYIRTYTRSELDALPDETDWERVDALTDEDIEKAALSDPDDPPTDADFWKDATVVMPENNVKFSLSDIHNTYKKESST